VCVVVVVVVVAVAVAVAVAVVVAVVVVVVVVVLSSIKCFEIEVGMHQGLALSPFLFVIVMEAISREFRVALTIHGTNLQMQTYHSNCYHQHWC